MTENIKNLIAEVKGVPPFDIEEDSDLLNEIGLNSLEVVSLMFRIEEEFEIELNFDSFNYEHLTSLSGLVNYLQECRKNSEDISP